jgi:DNA-binding NarL/FixJ family response regulator
VAAAVSQTHELKRHSVQSRADPELRRGHGDDARDLYRGLRGQAVPDEADLSAMTSRDEVPIETFERDHDRIRVLVVDSHDLFRTGIASLLASEPDIEVVGQASGTRAGVRLAHEVRPDVVLMELLMPDLHGSVATRMILERDPGVRVVMLTVASSYADIDAAMAAGACSFVAKDESLETVLFVVRGASHGATWLSPQAAEVVLNRLRHSHREPDLEPVELLSPRELDVLLLIARGFENAEIAETLHVSLGTVKNHVSNLLAKLALQSRVQAAIYAVLHGLT